MGETRVQSSPLEVQLGAALRSARDAGVQSAGDEEMGRGIQDLLVGAVDRFLSTSDLHAVVALAADERGGLRVLARSARTQAPDVPSDESLLAALAARAAPTDLGRPDAAAAERAAAGRGFGAGVALASTGTRPLAGVLVLGPQDPPGRVRPRTLAALAALACRLEGPLRTQAALHRLSGLEDDVRRLDRLASLGDLLSEVVHEIRNPLVSVKTFLQLLPDRIGDAEFRTRFLELASDEVRRIERLLDVVLEHARPSARQPAAATRVAPLLESVARLLSHRALEREVALEVHADPAALPVAMGEDGLRQVVLNLALNALDATPAAGRILLRATPLTRATEVAVDDDGPGVAPEYRERIFEPFFSTKRDRPGGLGLAICRRLVEEAAGEIRVMPRPGGGASFRITLPASA